MIKETKKDETVRKVKTSKSLKKPENYDTFRNEIAKTFGIKKKKSIILKLINTDGEEIAINDQEDLESFLDEMKEFQFYLEESEANDSPIIKKKPSKEESKSKNKVDDEEEEQPKKDDENKSDDGEDGGDDDDLNLEITNKEIESIIESQFKPIPEGNDDLIEDNPFDKEKYAKELNAKYSKVIQNFKDVFDDKISKIILENSKVIKSNVSSIIKSYSNTQLNNLEDITKEANGIIEGFSTLIVNTNEMYEVMENIEQKLNTIKEEDDENENENGNKGTNKIIRFEEENIVEEIELKKSKYFDVGGIIVENFSNKTFKHLYLVNKSSDNNVVIFGNTKTDKAHKLAFNGDCKPKDKGKHTITLKINDAKPNSQYKLCLYARETIDGPDLSKPLNITIKVKENEEDIRRKEEERRRKEEEDRRKIEEEENRRKEEHRFWDCPCCRRFFSKEEEIDYKGLIPNEVNALYEELAREFNLESIMDKKEVLEKIIDVQCDREMMNDWIFDQL